MKILKLFFVCLLFTLNSAAIVAKPNTQLVHVFSQYPNKTVIIKDPNYTTANAYFSGSTTFLFHIYNVGNQASVNQVIASFQKSSAVQSLVSGKITGDYQAFTLTLNSAQNKAWFIQEFKNAGLNTIVVNHDPIVDVDKL